jgi:hypothetical protein
VHLVRHPLCAHVRVVIDILQLVVIGDKEDHKLVLGALPLFVPLGVLLHSVARGPPKDQVQELVTCNMRFGAPSDAVGDYKRCIRPSNWGIKQGSTLTRPLPGNERGAIPFAHNRLDFRRKTDELHSLNTRHDDNKCSCSYWLISPLLEPIRHVLL